MLLHLALAADWDAAQQTCRYRMSTPGHTIDEVGYLHCCRDDAQLDRVRQRVLEDVAEHLVVLVLDEEWLGANGFHVIDEPSGVGERFPHVHGGDLPVDAVCDLRPVGDAGRHTIAELDAAMCSPYPSVRDGWAYTELASGIHEGRWDAAELAQIGHDALARLSHDRAEVRSFALLTLGWLADVDACERAWFDAGTRTWLAEKDTRGYDRRVGWVHAVAHGADLQGTVVRHGLAAPGEVLDHLVRRAMAHDDARYAQQEDARLAHAMIAALSAPDLSPQVAVGWLDEVERRLDAFEAAPTLPPPLWLANLQGTLAWLSIALDVGPVVDGEPVDVPHAAAVRRGIARVHARLAPWLVRVREDHQA